MNRKKSLEQECDETRAAVSNLMGYCLEIALNDAFRVGEGRLRKVRQRIAELGDELNGALMTPELRRCERVQLADRMQREWLRGCADTGMRVPRNRAARNRRERNLEIAGDQGASWTWALHAKACMDVLGFGPERLERLKRAALELYREVNQRSLDTDQTDALMQLKARLEQINGYGPLVLEEDGTEKAVKEAEQEADRMVKRDAALCAAIAAGRIRHGKQDKALLPLSEEAFRAQQAERLRALRPDTREYRPGLRCK